MLVYLRGIKIYNFNNVTHVIFIFLSSDIIFRQNMHSLKAARMLKTFSQDFEYIETSGTFKKNFLSNKLSAGRSSLEDTFSTFCAPALS